MSQRFYIAGDGTKYPLIEAMTPFSIMVYRTDCKKAVVGDPYNCLIAIGARRIKHILAAYIGSGKDAYVIMKIGKQSKPVAVHYTINAKASRVRDTFDKAGAPETQVITLSAPTPGRTLAHRSKLGKARNQAIKAGGPVKKRGKPNATRIMRLGVTHRPRAKIERNAVSLKKKA
jgi:hypothetical protein